MAEEAGRAVSDPWEDNARFWIQIVRERRDRYRTELTDAAVLGAVGDCHGLTALDAGCGEGYLSRELAQSGAARVVGVDTSPSLVRAAKMAAPSANLSYEVADVARLPLAAGEFDLVVANHVLNDVRDMESPLYEFARVLGPAGCLVMLVLHPCFYGGRIERQLQAMSRPVEGYFAVRSVEQRFEVDGLVSPSLAAYWLRPLEDYTRALASAGFLISDMREPHPSSEQLAAEPWWQENFRRPMFLLITAVKRS